MLLINLRRSIGVMKKNDVITVLRVFAGVAAWFIVSKGLGNYVDSIVGGTWGMILKSMVIPYTLGLLAFFLACIGMPAKKVETGSYIAPTAGLLLKAFIVQTGLSFPLVFIINIITRLTGHELSGISPEDLFGNMWFYLVLLLVFNPVLEEVLFRKLVLERLAPIGFKGAVIVSAVLFAMPHLYSQGIAQVPYTFAIGLVLAWLTVKTGKLWPAIVLHALSNVYGAYIPVGLGLIHPACSVLFVLFTMGVIVPLTVVILTHKKKQ